MASMDFMCLYVLLWHTLLILENTLFSTAKYLRGSKQLRPTVQVNPFQILRKLI